MMFSFLKNVGKHAETKIPWYRDAVIYQIYPRSFQDSNQDGIGDIRGIIQRIPHLVSLGVGAVWISPIYTSPMKDGGYDIADFYTIDPLFGTLSEFDELVSELHNNNIKVIMDLVVNHTSDKHPWFIESKSSRTNPKRDWYVWRDGKKDGNSPTEPPNNWLSVSGGSAWTLDHTTDQYYLHHFLSEQPDLNWRNEEVKNEIERIAEFWINRGVDGFRVDAMSHFIEDGLFRDDPQNSVFVANKTNPYDKYVHTFSTNRPQLKQAISLLCNTINAYPEKFILFETYVPLADMLAIYNMHPDEHHAPFNFNFLTLPWNARTFKTFVDTFDTSLKPHHIPTYVLGNHDQPRLATRFGTEKARVCALMLLTLRGMPFIYYGEEIGMTQVSIPKEKIQDSFAHNGKNVQAGRDGSRTPMQWDSSPFAGFSTHEPWLPISDTYSKNNVSSQAKDPRSILSLYKKIIAFRNNSHALRYGSYMSKNTESDDVFTFIRSHGKERVHIFLNFSNADVHIPFLEQGTIILSTELDIKENTPTSAHLHLRPYEGLLILLNQS